MTETIATLFSGFDLAGQGAKAANYELAWGIEKEAAIAEVGNFNHGDHIKVASILDCDPFDFERPNLLWASPPCPNFSVAKTKRGETELDIALARKIVDFLTVLQPDKFVLENVEAYKSSISLAFIEGALYTLGYMCNRSIVNFADFGIPQTRRRLILRAIKGAFVPPLPQKQKWRGWYGVLLDLIPTLKESHLAPWQLKALPEHLVNLLFQAGNTQCNRIEKFRREDYPAPTICASEALAKAVLCSRNQSERGDTHRYGDQVAYAVTTGAVGRTKAVLIDGTEMRNLSLKGDEEPAIAVKASVHKGMSKAVLIDGQQSQGSEPRTDQDPAYTVTATAAKGMPAALDLSNAKVVSISVRCLARWQTLPDSYVLPEKATLACRGIGNGVPCDGAQMIVESMKL